MVDDNKIAKYLYHGYEYSIVRHLKDVGVKSRSEALCELKKYILINIRNFKINDSGKNNKINESMSKILRYFKDNDFKKMSSHL